MSQAINVLLIEDNRIEARQTQHWLASAKVGLFEVECVETLQKGMDRLAKGGINVVLLDLNLPDSRSEATFETLYARFPEVPIVNETARKCKKLWPTAAVVIGGGQATVTPELFEKEFIDLIVRGPGERVWRDLCKTGVKPGPCRTCPPR